MDIIRQICYTIIKGIARRCNNKLDWTDIEYIKELQSSEQESYSEEDTERIQRLTHWFGRCE